MGSCFEDSLVIGFAPPLTDLKHEQQELSRHSGILIQHPGNGLLLTVGFHHLTNQFACQLDFPVAFGVELFDLL